VDGSDGRGTPLEVALGLAVLAAERLGARSGGALHVTVGVARSAIRTVWRGAARLEGPGASWLRDVTAGPRRQGQAIVDGSRMVALRFARDAVDEGLAWIAPRLIDATIPLLRAEVLPVVIKDLTDDPLLRTLVLEQSRGVVSQAADQLRNATAHADDRVENLFRGLIHWHRDR
jgi:hypothetical protein